MACFKMLWLLNRSVNASIFLGLVSLTVSTMVLAHPGHDHGAEFEAGTAQPVGGIRVDTQTAARVGLVVEPVSKDVLEIGLRTTAQVDPQPDQQVMVNASINGTIAELLVQPGDLVRRGQPLVVVKAPELIDLRVNAQRSFTQATAEVRRAQANLTLAQENYQRQRAIAAAEIQAAQRQVAFAQDRYQRDQELAAAGALARQQVLSSEAELANAQRELTQANSRKAVLEAEAEIKRAQADLDAANVQVQLSTGIYETRLQQLNSPQSRQGLVTVVAPITGRIASRPITLGESVEEAVTPLLQIVNRDRLQVTGNLPEKDSALIQHGQRVRASVNSLPGQFFYGEVVVIGDVVNEQTRMIAVTAQLDNSHDQLKPQMFAELEILTEQTPTPVLSVPRSAVVEIDGRTLVFVQNGDAFEPVDVTVGRQAGNRLEITHGLFEGDQVVVQGGLQLYAQSLRGASNTAEALEEEPISRGRMLGWGVIPLGGAIAIGAFILGRRWGRHPKTIAPRATPVRLEELLEEDSAEQSPGAIAPWKKAGVE